MSTEKLQTALDATTYKGLVTKVFSSKFGHKYDVGLVRLESGEDVVIKIKDNPRSKKYANVYTREAEYRNLKALERIESALIPKALYYKNGVLLMSFMRGQILREVTQNNLDLETLRVLGSTMRNINDIDTSNMDYLTRFNSFRDFLNHEIELLFSERLQLNLLPLSFYEEFREKMSLTVDDKHPADIALIAKDAYGAENILVHEGKISGLIDFEDLMIAPRLLQLRPPIESQYLPHYIEGYGREVFEKNYCQKHLNILKAISSLRALYLSHEQNANDWENNCINNFNTLMDDLECNMQI